MSVDYGEEHHRRRGLRRRDWLMTGLGAVVALSLVGLVVVVKLATRPTPIGWQQAGLSIRWLPETVTKWRTPINQMSQKYNVDANLLAIVVALESGGYSKAVSEADAQGLMQLTPATAGDIAKKYLEQPRSDYDLLDPNTNIEFGAAYLAFLRDEFGEHNQAPSWNATAELVAAGYNGGPGAAGKLYHGQGLTDTQTVIYSRDVYNMWRERQSDSSPTFDRWLERGGSRLIDAAQNE